MATRFDASASTESVSLILFFVCVFKSINIMAHLAFPLLL